MAAGEESRKVHCDCSKLLATFTEEGSELFCRFSKETTWVAHGLRRSCVGERSQRHGGPRI